MATPERVVLVDGTAIVFRSWYALPTTLSASSGLITNAIFGFANTFRKLFAGRRPTWGAVVFDAPGRTFRDEKYAEYKADRGPMSPDLVTQLPWIDKVVAANGFPILRVPGYEADDVIGTLAVQAAERGHEVHIVSVDKDFAQLISDRIKMFDPIRDVTYDPELVRKKWGTAPERFCDLLALMGDKIDNVPGVPGIGKKGAATLLERFGDLDTVLASTDQLKGRQKATLEEHRDLALLSRELVTIDVAVPLDRGVEDLHLPDVDVAARDALYVELEFFSLISEDARAAAEDAPVPDARYARIETLESLRSTVDWLMDPRTTEPIAVVPVLDLEPPAPAPLAGLALATEPGEAWYVPLAAPGEAGLGAPALDALRRWLEDSSRPKVAHDAKELYVALRRAGVTLRGVVDDVRLASFLVDPGGLIPHRLEQLAREYLHRVLTPRSSVVGAGKATKAVSECPPDEVAPWACQLADAVLSMAAPLRERLELERQVAQLLENDLPLSWVLGEMELTGLRIDADALAQAEEDFAARVDAAEARAWELAGHEFNLKSTKQLSAVLFDELQLPVIKRTKTGYSTNAEVLERLAPDHEIARVVLEHRKFIKLINTYTAVLRAAVRPDTGRVHCNTQQTTGVSGRLITTDPDLQRTPVSTEEGKRVRAAFVTGPGWKIISADWSQIELRVLAHFSGDPLLVDSFARGVDVHARTAGQLFDVPTDEVDPDQRRVGKTVNFATIYGQGATALAQLLGVPRRDAKRYQERYFAAYSGVREWLDRTIEEADEAGFVTTLLGRRRYIPELSSNDKMLRQAGGRIAANTPIQGSAADICKLVMLRIPRELREAGLKTRMLLQIHDELLFEAPDDEVDASCAIVREAMETVVPLKVPLVVDIGVGDSWADAK